MKTTINGKRYDSSRCESLCDYDHHNNGNYSGTSHLLLASDGTYLIWTDTNGQDCWTTDKFCECCDVTAFIDQCDPDPAEEERLVELELIEIIR